MDTTADTTRHLATIWRGDKSWQWKAIFVGHAQPFGHRNYWRSSRNWRLHFTPIYASRDWSKWAIGLCLGKRTIYLYSHR